MVTDAMTDSTPLISVCVCTYRRPRQLQRLLQRLDQQVTNALFKFSIVVVDNDARESARSIVNLWAERSSVPIAYSVEPRQNIALARNTSVSMATGEIVAFVDDDEEPSADWLRRLYEVLVESAADGVLGPVVPKYEEGAPKWAVKGKVFQRPSFETGEVIDWREARTGNALVRREVLLELDGPFDSQFGAGGEDKDLFRRAMSRGRLFVWSAEAVCHELVTLDRARVPFQLRRALLRGWMSLRGPDGGWRGIMKSVIALPAYTVVLPVCLMMGAPVFVTYLVRSFDHLGRLLGAVGIKVVGDTYITHEQ